MKKTIFTFAVATLLLAGCSSAPQQPKLENGTSVNTENVQPVSEGTYRAGDLVIHIEDITSSADYNFENYYYFGGFVDNNTFTIMNERHFSHGGAGETFYYTLKDNMIFTLPESKIKVKVTGYDAENNTLSLEQLK